MASKTRLKDKRQRGISLPEILIVLTILGILVALAVPSFTKADVQLQRQNIAQQLKTNFERARFDSIKRNAASNQMAKVVINSATSFSTTLDLNSNGTLESNETRVTTLSAGSGAKIVGSNLIFPITVTFNQRGQAEAINGVNAAITPSFVICGQNCTFATANETNSNTLSISPTGTVALVEKGQAFFDRVLPTIEKAIGTGDKINSNAQVKN